MGVLHFVPPLDVRGPHHQRVRAPTRPGCGLGLLQLRPFRQVLLRAHPLRLYRLYERAGLYWSLACPVQATIRRGDLSWGLAEKGGGGSSGGGHLADFSYDADGMSIL